MDQRIRTLEGQLHTLAASLTLKTSSYNTLEDDVSTMEHVMEQHTNRLGEVNLPQDAKYVARDVSTSSASTSTSSPSTVISSDSTDSTPTGSAGSATNITKAARDHEVTKSTRTKMSTDDQSRAHIDPPINAAPSYSGLTRDLGRNPGHILLLVCVNKATCPPTERQRCEMKGSLLLGTFTNEGAPTIGHVFLYHVDGSVSEDTVNNHMNDNNMQFISLRIWRLILMLCLISHFV